MSRPSTTYSTYYIYGLTKLSDKLISLNNQRGYGLTQGKTQWDYYEKYLWLQSYVLAIAPDRIGNLSTIQINNIIDKIEDLCL